MMERKSEGSEKKDGKRGKNPLSNVVVTNRLSVGAKKKFIETSNKKIEKKREETRNKKIEKEKKERRRKGVERKTKKTKAEHQRKYYEKKTQDPTFREKKTI